MIFEWHTEKAQSNLAKHGVSFELACRVWDDPLHDIRSDRVENGEERWIAVGLVGSTLVLVVAHAYPDESDEQRVRLISARKATPHERRRYEQQAL